MKHAWLPLWTIPIIILFAVGTVWIRLSIVRTSYEINQTEKTIRSLHQEQEHLSLKLAALRSPRKLEGLARNKFGLSQPKSHQIIHMKDPDAQ